MTGWEFLRWVLFPVLLITVGSVFIVGPNLFYWLALPLFIASVAMMAWRVDRCD
jgi:hypothetical protein